MASLQKAKTQQCLFNCHKTVTETCASLSMKIKSPEVDGRETGSMGSLALQWKSNIFVAWEPWQSSAGQGERSWQGRITEGVMLHWNLKPIRHISSPAAQTETAAAGHHTQQQTRQRGRGLNVESECHFGTPESPKHQIYSKNLQTLTDNISTAFC